MEKEVQWALPVVPLCQPAVKGLDNCLSFHTRANAICRYLQRQTFEKVKWGLPKKYPPCLIYVHPIFAKLVRAPRRVTDMGRKMNQTPCFPGIFIEI
jgi:hypothetical protein